MWIVCEYYRNDNDFRFAVSTTKPIRKKVIKVNSLRREYSWRVEDEGEVIYHLSKKQSMLIADWLDEQSRKLLMEIVRNKEPRECKLEYDVTDANSGIVCKMNEYLRQSIYNGLGEVIIPVVPMWAIFEEDKKISIRQK